MRSIFLLFFSLILFKLSASDFTISSYNVGGLPGSYDYLRAVCMQKLMQERYLKEPEIMAVNEKIQKLALQILFTKNPVDLAKYEKEWDEKRYSELFQLISKPPQQKDSLNTIWNQKAEEMITSYKIRPVSLFDEDVKEILQNFTQDIEKERILMAERIFKHHIKTDLICLQEADILDFSIFPEHLKVLFAITFHSVNGIAWNKDRFSLIEEIGDIAGRAFAVQLLDQETGKTINVVSGHISGCNPFQIEIDLITGKNDAEKGDQELKRIFSCLKEHPADLHVFGMDSNVTSLHPRLQLLKEEGFALDSDHFFESTCTNPHQILDTRIDWIVIKTDLEAKITNIPILSVPLNHFASNISDHKPIGAKISY